jgi:hypothetical protein
MAFVFFQMAFVFFQTAFVFFQMALVFSQTALVFVCSYKGSTKNRLVATDNRLLISLFGAKVAHVARFFEFITRARKNNACGAT